MMIVVENWLDTDDHESCRIAVKYSSVVFADAEEDQPFILMCQACEIDAMML